METKKLTKTHENAIYAIKHNLKRLKKSYNGAAQTSNFNKFIAFHKEYVSLSEEFALLGIELNYKRLREYHSRLNSIIYYRTNSYKFPNLYHYAVEEIKNSLIKLYSEVYNVLPSYNFDITGCNKTIDDDGVRSFRTPEEMWRGFNTYHDTDSTANFTFRGKVYYPHKRDDCEEVFRLIEEENE